MCLKVYPCAHIVYLSVGRLELVVAALQDVEFTESSRSMFGYLCGKFQKAIWGGSCVDLLVELGWSDFGIDRSFWKTEI